MPSSEKDAAAGIRPIADLYLVIMVGGSRLLATVGGMDRSQRCAGLNKEEVSARRKSVIKDDRVSFIANVLKEGASLNTRRCSNCFAP